MTLNLSEAKNHGCRPHPRGSVRRASGFVLTGKPEVTRLKRKLVLRFYERLRAPALCQVPPAC